MDSVFLMLKVRRELARHSVFSFAECRADSRHSVFSFAVHRVDSRRPVSSFVVHRADSRRPVSSFAVHRADSRRPAKSKFHSIHQFQLLTILTIKTSIIWQLNDTWETQYIKNFRVYKCRRYTNT